jgi:AraC-like DNA-binding protein
MTAPTPRTRITRGRYDASDWEVAQRTLPTALRPYVRRMTGYVERTARPLVRREYPQSCVVTIIEFSPPVHVALAGGPGARHVGGFVAGLGDRFARVAHEGLQHGIQLDLTLAGAAHLLGLPLGEIAGRVVALSDLLPGAERELPSRLHELRTWDERFALLERLLAQRVAETEGVPAAVTWALERLAARDGALELRALARELGYSRKHVIALFRRHVGVTPGAFARLVRFERAMAQVKAGAVQSWAELALDCGYYDQSHLAREVKRYTGLTPTTLPVEQAELAGLFT